MCLNCCGNPEDSGSDDPKSKLLSPDLPQKIQKDGKKIKSSKKVKKLKLKAEKDKKVTENPELSDTVCQNTKIPHNSHVPVDTSKPSEDQVLEAERRDQFPPEWNTKAAKFAASTFVGMGLAKRNETLTKTVDKSTELSDSTRHYRSLSKKLKEKQEAKLKNSKLLW